MDASPAKIIQYFNGEKQNVIPLFQRPYSWRDDNWITMWDDILVQYDSEDKYNHFMGAIVSLPARSVPVGVSKFLIIDGQQRLTTMSILLAALRDCVDDTTAKRIQEVYLTNRYREIDDTPKLVPTQVDRLAYHSIAIKNEVSDVDDENLIKRAYNFFRNKLKNSTDLNGCPVDPKKVLETVEQSLQVVMINLADEDDPYLIFESLNFKGQELTQADLVRNYILMRFRHSVASGGEQENIFLKFWSPMEVRLKSYLTEFLRYYAMMGGDKVYQTGIYSAIKARFSRLQNTLDVELELAHMAVCSELYAVILDPKREASDDCRQRLDNIRSLGAGTSHPLLLRLMEARKSGELTVDQLEKCLHLVESFVLRRAVVNVPTNSLNKLFLQWTKQFPVSDHVNALWTYMSSGSGGGRFPSDHEFGQHFKESAQYGRGATRFVLEQLEKSFKHKEIVDLSCVTIEHIMPQTLSADWIKELGSEATQIHDRFIDTFGNLTLTGYNTELGNLSFGEKSKKLDHTHIELNRDVTDQKRWTETEIRARSEDLLNRSLTLWSGPLEKQTDSVTV